jgi:hypothetical protein
MNSSSPRRKADTLFEYALFAAILTMTVAGAFLYKSIVSDPLLSGLVTYLVVAYLGFLGLAFSQLNRLHRRRRVMTPEPEPQPVTYAVKRPKAILGLTFGQIAIVAFVFATACATFTWALSVAR